tara:strand:+ start:4582 stop:5328 length:747 start_codon:yes stop_codon:yes gene_type:complete
MEENHAILVAYIITLVYGTAKNFHLLENFKAVVYNKININDIKTKEDSDSNTISLTNLDIKNNTKPSPSTIDLLAKKNNDSVISEELINQFINKVKDIDNLLIVKTKRNIYDLKPTIKKMRKNRIETMKKKLNVSKIVKPIIISNDNFIVDGHYRWFVRKNLIETNTNGLSENELYEENINIIMIDYNIKDLLRKLKEFKIKYNEEYLSKSVIDIHKLKEGKTLIKNLKRDISLLEQNYEMINNLKIV